MKSIKSVLNWILFVPVCAMAVALITICGLNPDSIKDIFATDLNGIAEIIAFSVLGLFVACFVFSLFDRKTSPVHILRKNYFSGAMAFVGAFGLACTAALDVTNMVELGNITVMPVITALFTGVSGLAMLFVGINHFTGSNTPKNVSILYLSLPLWCGVHLIDRFLKHTAMPVAAADTLDLIMFVALAMFFIYSAMIHSLIPGKNAVKSAITFGFPTVVISLVYGISLVFSTKASDSNTFIDFIPSVTYIVIGLYVLGFVSELSFLSKSVEEQMLLMPEETDDTEDDNKEDGTETDMSEDVSSVVVVDDNYTSDSDEVSYNDYDVSDDEPEYVSQTHIADAHTVPVVEDVQVAEEDSYGSDEAVSEIDSVESFADITLFDDVESVAVTMNSHNDSAEASVEDDIPVLLPEVQEESDAECDIAEELFREAQERDAQKEKETVSQSTVSESDDNMIIDDDSAVVSTPAAKPAGFEHRPKGRTIRETVVFDDEDFILAIDGSDSVSVKENSEDISTYILGDTTSSDTAETHGQNRSYADRLDEIDQLIISIQGGDSSAED